MSDAAPSSLKVMGRKIKIKVKDLDSDHGQYVHDESTIYLSNNPEHQKDMKATLLHELVHVVLTIGGVAEVLGPEKEEAVCRAVENLAPILIIKA